MIPSGISGARRLTGGGGGGGAGFIHRPMVTGAVQERPG